MKSIYSWVHPNTCIKSVPNNGKGVFATGHIRKGEIVAVFSGYAAKFQQRKRCSDYCWQHSIQIDDEFFLSHDLKNTMPEKCDYFNHSCNPNCGLKGQVLLEAMQNVKTGEEITFDYAMTVSNSIARGKPFIMDCTCGAKNCRKIITGNDWKNKELQKKYNGYFSYFIQQKLDKTKK